MAGTGYSHYTMAGGTNFENWGAAEQGTNYDFGAPIGQAGDLRDVYYGLKRAATVRDELSPHSGELAGRDRRP